MERLPQERGLLHRLFEASLLAKGLFAAAETLAGLGFLLAPGTVLHHWATRLVELDLVEDISEPMAQRLERLTMQFGAAQQQFYAEYLISHGVAKLIMVGFLAARIKAAYPLSILVQCGFIAYQMERWVHSHSIFMLAVSIFDAFVIWLIWKEWKNAGPGDSWGKPIAPAKDLHDGLADSVPPAARRQPWRR